MKRLRRFLGGLMPAGLVGAFATLSVGRTLDPEGSRTGLLLVGWIYGVAVVGILRIFRVPPWCYPWLGLVCGPVPAALLPSGDQEPGDRGGLLLITALLGLLVGLVEWGRRSRSEEESPS
jgi:hypothetical protein